MQFILLEISGVLWDKIRNPFFQDFNINLNITSYSREVDLKIKARIFPSTELTDI